MVISKLHITLFLSDVQYSTTAGVYFVYYWFVQHLEQASAIFTTPVSVYVTCCIVYITLEKPRTTLIKVRMSYDFYKLQDISYPTYNFWAFIVKQIILNTCGLFKVDEEKKITRKIFVYFTGFSKFMP